MAGRAGSGECLQLMECFRFICNDIGVPLAEEKTLGPSCIMTFLGLEIDTLKMVIRIPRDKLLELKVKLEIALTKKKKLLLRTYNLFVALLIFALELFRQQEHSTEGFLTQCLV